MDLSRYGPSINPYGPAPAVNPLAAALAGPSPISGGPGGAGAGGGAGYGGGPSSAGATAAATPQGMMQSIPGLPPGIMPMPQAAPSYSVGPAAPNPVPASAPFGFGSLQQYPTSGY